MVVTKSPYHLTKLFFLMIHFFAVLTDKFFSLAKPATKPPNPATRPPNPATRPPKPPPVVTQGPGVGSSGKHILSVLPHLVTVFIWSLHDDGG